MSFRLIINADDFGFSRGMTDGILRCHREGVLTSTTLMTTMPDRDRAIDLAGQTPTLGVGIHLCLTQGQPLTKCHRLLNRDGAFPRRLPALFLKLSSKDARLQAQDELTAQIQYAQKRALTPTHTDSHKHVCHWTALHDPLLAACKTTGITWIRTAREVRNPALPKLPPLYRLLTHFADKLAQRITAAGLHTTDWFFGMATLGNTNAQAYNTLINSHPTGLGELMVHPGYAHDITPADTRLLKHRETEMEALCNPAVRQALAQANVQLGRYGER